MTKKRTKRSYIEKKTKELSSVNDLYSEFKDIMGTDRDCYGEFKEIWDKVATVGDKLSPRAMKTLEKAMLKMRNELREEDYNITPLTPRFKNSYLSVDGHSFDYRCLGYFEYVNSKDYKDGFKLCFDKGINKKNVFDLVPCLIVGLSELYSLQYGTGLAFFKSVRVLLNSDKSALIDSYDKYNLLMRVGQTSSTLSDISNIDTLKDRFMGMSDETIKNLQIFYKTIFSLRTPRQLAGFDSQRIAINILNVIYILDDKIFWKFYFKLLNKVLECFVYEDVPTKRKLNSGVDIDYYKFGKILYNSGKKDEKKHYISDGRGFSICITMQFVMYFMKLSKQYTSKKYLTYNYDEEIEYFKKQSVRCIGTDSFSNIFRNTNIPYSRNKDLKKEHEEWLLQTSQTRGYLIYDETVVSINGYDEFREDVEEYILFKKAYGVYKDTKYKHTPNPLTQINQHYSSITYMVFAISDLAYSSSFFLDNIQDHEKELNKKDKEISNLTMERNNLKKKLDKLEEQNRQRKDKSLHIERLSKQVEQLTKERDLYKQQKNTYLKERDKLQEELNSFFTDEQRISSQGNEKFVEKISLDEKINFLNDFKIYIFGGRFDLGQQLIDLGLINIKQIDNVNTLSMQQPTLDFGVFVTDFLSHTLFNRVKSLYDTECLMSFTGSNKERLIHQLYQYVVNYLEN